MNNKTVIRLPKRKNRNRIPVTIIETLARMTISLFLDRCLEGNQIKATAAIDGESNTGSTLPEPSQPPPAVRIVSQNAWADDSNQYTGRSFHIVGEVINQSSEILNDVKVVATLYDTNNQVVGTDSTYLEINNNFYPGEKSPFKITITNDDGPIQQLSSYTLAIDWS
jgi:hypothetical protein